MARDLASEVDAAFWVKLIAATAATAAAAAAAATAAAAAAAARNCISFSVCYCCILFELLIPTMPSTFMSLNNHLPLWFQPRQSSNNHLPLWFQPRQSSNTHLPLWFQRRQSSNTHLHLSRASAFDANERNQRGIVMFKLKNV